MNPQTYHPEPLKQCVEKTATKLGHMLHTMSGEKPCHLSNISWAPIDLNKSKLASCCHQEPNPQSDHSVKMI